MLPLTKDKWTNRYKTLTGLSEKKKDRWMCLRLFPPTEVVKSWQACICRYIMRTRSYTFPDQWIQTNELNLPSVFLGISLDLIPGCYLLTKGRKLWPEFGMDLNLQPLFQIQCLDHLAMTPPLLPFLDYNTDILLLIWFNVGFTEVVPTV